MKTLARWSFQHRWTVLALWVLALVGVNAVSAVTGSAYSDNFQPPHTDSTRVQRMLETASPAAAGDTSRIVFATSSGSIADGGKRVRIEATVRAVGKLPHVASVTSPFSPSAQNQVSQTGRIAYATVQFDKVAADLPLSAATKVVDTARSHQGDGLQIELGGQAISAQTSPSLGGVGFGLLAAAVVLFLVFGSLVAMGVPLATAVLSVGTSLAIINILSNSLAMPTFTSQLASLLGLGVGVDYALFIVSRHRQSLVEGRSPEESAVRAVNTSGRAVLFAGITVCIALLGMFAIGLTVFNGIAIGATIAVLTTVLAALTLQPALLSLFGFRVLGRRQWRRLASGQPATGTKSGMWEAVTMGLRRRPSLHAAVGLLAIGILVIPFFSLRLGFSDAGNDPTNTTTRRAYDLLARGFGPGFNGPLILAADNADPGARAAFAAALARVGDTPGVAAVSPAASVGTAQRAVLVASVIPTTAPQDRATSSLVTRLRDDTLPTATRNTNLRVRVGGPTAAQDDVSHTIAGHLALFICLVIALSFILLAAVFRSLLVPLLAAVMNLLSVGAAFGVVTAVFEKGWLKGVIGLQSTGPIEPFIPVIVFAILFGISMDYEVFLVTRMHEIWSRTKDNTEAVTQGLAQTGRIITAAAAIMVFVFGAFTLGDNRIVKLFGLGLASAVLIDALIIRTFVLPAVMLMLGRRNWGLPVALERRLPSLNIEGAESPAAPLPTRHDSATTPAQPVPPPA